MADIILAREQLADGDNRLVVLKKIRPNLAKDKKFLEMFLDEARLSTLLDHPNVVRSFELCSQNKQSYIVMEYLEGESLAFLVSQSLRTGFQMPTALAAGIAAQAAEGLHYAHNLNDEKGVPLNIIHRDISPQNIIVLFDGGVKVLDFGIARAKDRIHQTRTGITKGKAAYMSPEQCLGKKMDGRSDIFALGAVIWEVLAGRRLFKREQEMDTLMAVVREKTPEIRTFCPEISDVLESIVMRCLDKDPNKRYANASELATTLWAYLKDSNQVGDKEAISTFVKTVLADRIATKQKLLDGIDAGEPAEPEEMTALKPDTETALGDGSNSQQEIMSDIRSTISEGATSEMSTVAAPLDLTDHLSDMDEHDDKEERVEKGQLVGDAAGVKAVVDLGQVPELPLEEENPDTEPPIPSQDTCVVAIPTGPENLPDTTTSESEKETVYQGKPLPAVKPGKTRWIWLMLGMSVVLLVLWMVWPLGSSETQGPGPADVLLSPTASVDAGQKTPVDASKGQMLDAGEEAPTDAGEEAPTDAGEEAPTDAGEEAPTDAGEEAPTDAGEEAPTDAGEEAPTDAGEPTQIIVTAKAWASVSSKPKGCRVRVDGSWLEERTPIAEIELVAEKRHELAVNCKGHRRAMQSIKPEAGQVIKLEFKPTKIKRPKTGRLRLNTEPWTEVYLRGKSLGITPLLGARLPPGEHVLKLVNKEMKINKTLKIKIRAGRTTNVLKRL
ncbi:MAG: protein kinase [Deltaproteobacteria bacterium]|nr:protein kinase [Deltaproteobacteria bacterium]